MKQYETMEDNYSEVAQENIASSKREYERENDESDDKQAQFEAVKNAVADAKFSLSLRELAKAITSGLFAWPNQVKSMITLIQEIAEESGEPMIVESKVQEEATL